MPEFVRIVEDRRFVFDICDRVDALAAALDRLRELYQMYAQLDKKQEHAIAKQRLSDPQRVSFEVPAEIHREMNHCHREARALVTFMYYELTTAVNLLRLEPGVGSHLEYLVGVRNKVLAHPSKEARIKNSSSALTIGPILHAHLMGAQTWIPMIREWYLKELRDLGKHLDDDAGTAANVALLRDRKKKVESLRPEERLRLKAYVIPEPDLLGSARDLAELLESKFLVEVDRACTATLT